MSGALAVVSCCDTIRAMIKRRKTRQLHVADVPIGGDAPIAIQSMCNTHTTDVRSTLAQIRQLALAGCDIVRVGIPDRAAARALRLVKEKSPLPIVADIHFDHELALVAVESGADKIRINPGNLGRPADVALVARQCARRNIPVRVGINGGSLGRFAPRGHGSDTAKAMVRAASWGIDLLRRNHVKDIAVSLKASDVMTTVRANRLFAARSRLPLHLGITEAGTFQRGTVYSSIGLGMLLAEGIGDTIRVSLSADPVKEIHVAKDILGALKLGGPSVTVVACPTCARAHMDVSALALKIENDLRQVCRQVRIAVMGCEVNGPGEAAHSDWALVGTKSGVSLWKKGRIIARGTADRMTGQLIRQVRSHGL